MQHPLSRLFSVRSKSALSLISTGLNTGVSLADVGFPAVERWNGMFVILNIM